VARHDFVEPDWLDLERRRRGWFHLGNAGVNLRTPNT